MMMPDYLKGRFQRLRWQLTMSYAGVAIGVLLVISIAGVVAVYFSLVATLQSGYWKEWLIDAATFEYAPALRLHLKQSPPDHQGIEDWLQRFEVATTSLPLAGSIPLFLDAGDLRMIVIDSGGDFLAMTPPTLLEDAVVGEALDVQHIPKLHKLLEVALAGETDPTLLYAQPESEQEILFAVPIWDVAEKQVLGAMIIQLDIQIGADFAGDIIGDIVPALLIISGLAGILGVISGFFAARGLVKRLSDLDQAAQEWSQGNFKLLVDDPSNDELGQLARNLNQMAQQLQDLFETRRELAIVEERNRLARDLHDSAKQHAFALATRIAASRKLLMQNPESASTHLEQAEQLAYDLRQELTALIMELRPAALEGHGLSAAIRDYGSQWSVQFGIMLEARISGERSLPLKIEQAVFRIMQEALANVARHSGAKQVEIKLEYLEGDLQCMITDDGHGFDRQAQQGGFGLISMQQRTESLGGVLQIESSASTGTTIRLSVPLAETTGRG